jgi:NDP-sugar pyrophosphorylase family protein
LKKHLIIIGAGGAGREAVDIFFRMKNKSNIDLDLLGFLDDNISIIGVEINSVKVISSIKNWMPKENEYFVCAIANRSIRKKIIDDLTIKKAKFINLIDPSSIISKFATIGIGNIIYPNTIISSNVIVGNHVIINMNTVLGHDAKIGDNTIISC